MNNVSIIGRLTTDVELRATATGTPAVSIFIAINNGKDQEGNERPADFPKIYVYESQAENMSKYCHKGSLVGITGKIKTRKWEKDDGTNGYETYILANRVLFLDSKQNKNTEIPEPDYKPAEEPKKEEKDPFAEFGETVEIESDLLD